MKKTFWHMKCSFSLFWLIPICPLELSLEVIKKKKKKAFNSPKIQLDVLSVLFFLIAPYS